MDNTYISIPKDLIEDVINELICCRRLRENNLSDYCKNNNEADGPTYNMQVNIFKESIEHTKNLYDSLNRYI